LGLEAENQTPAARKGAIAARSILMENERPLRIKFVDFWNDLNLESGYFSRLLKETCNFELSDDPEIIIFGCYGSEHLRYRCHKIFFASENVRPPRFGCDYSVGFDFSSHEKHLRLPLYILYGDPLKLAGKSSPPPDATERRFCCFVVSNGKCKERNDFFDKLSQYKKVDSGGRFRNNVGGPIENKRSFIRQYKFTIAFENSSTPGYTTEKIFEPMLEGSIPIYWGNPRISEEFNTKSFVNVHDYPNLDAVVEVVKKIDRNHDVYCKMLQEPWFHEDKVPREISRDFILSWFQRVFSEFRKHRAISSTPFYYCNYVDDRFRQIMYWASKWSGVVEHRR
jgi:alpha(1,3/1,4) fucosyltransferase